MKRKWLFALAMALGVLSAQAQPDKGTVSVIPRVGMNLANMTNNEVVVNLMNQDETLKSRLKPGLTAGVDVEYQATGEVAVSMGLHYSRQGSRYPDFERRSDGMIEGYSNWHYDLDYLNLPLLLSYRIAKGFCVKAGLQVGSLLNAKEIHSFTEIIPLEGGGRQQGKAQETNTDLGDACKKVDFSVPIGVSYEFENVVIDARYNFGLTRIYDLDVVKSCNSVIQLTVGYRISL